MDVNIILTLVGIGGSMIAFSWGIIKHLTKRIDDNREFVMEKIEYVKEKYVRHEYLELEIKHIADTQKEIKDEIKTQGENIIALLTRRRDD